MISSKDYCSKICGGKCCYVYDEEHEVLTACPKLDPETKLCTIYKERYEENKPFSFGRCVVKNNKLHVLNVRCGSVEKDILGKGILPPEIERKCCYRKPILLKRYNQNEIQSKKSLEEGL